MNYEQILALALGLLNSSLQLVAQIRAQAGMTDEQILEHASTVNADTRDTIEKFIASLPPTEE